jgi:hypothetical protein
MDWLMRLNELRNQNPRMEISAQFLWQYGGVPNLDIRLKSLGM